jgi:rubrerythrin
MKKITISITAISLYLFSCSNTFNEKSKQKTETVTQEEHQHNDEMQTIELNNGEKWKVDANMITHIRNTENDIISFSTVEQKDYKSLVEKLQSNIDLLTSNCIMKGKAHDELHKWLLPYIDLVKELSEAKVETEASKQFENIQTSFTTFNQYFQ